jgi:hypothetical protein
MFRTEIRLTKEQARALRNLSAATGKSVAELVRNAVDQCLAGRWAIEAEDRIERAVGIAGAFASGGSGASSEHDRYLAEALDRGQS